MCVSESAATATRDHHAVAGPHQIGGQAVLGANLRTWRHRQDQVFTCFTMLTSTATVAAALCEKVPALGEVQQGGHALLRDQVHAASSASVAPIGSAEGYELLPSERHDAVAAVPSFHPDASLVDVNGHGQVTMVGPGRSTRPQVFAAVHRGVGTIPLARREFQRQEIPRVAGNDERLRLVRSLTKKIRQCFVRSNRCGQHVC